METSRGHEEMWLEGDMEGEYHFLKESDHPSSEIFNPSRSSESELNFSESSLSHEGDPDINTDEIFNSNYVDYSFGEEQDIAAFDLSADDEQDAGGLWGDSDMLFPDELAPHTSTQLLSIAHPKNLDTGQPYRRPLYRGDFPRSIKNANSSLRKRYHSDKDGQLIYEDEYRGSGNIEGNSNGFSSYSPLRHSEQFDPNRYPLPKDYVRNIINRKDYQETENTRESNNKVQTSGNTNIASGRQSLVMLPLQSGSKHGRKKPPPGRAKSGPHQNVNRNQPVAIVINRGASTIAPKSRPISLTLSDGLQDRHVVPIGRRPPPPRYHQNLYKVFRLPVIDRTAVILFLVFIAALSVGPLVQILFATSQGKKRNKDAKASLLQREDDVGSPILELHRQVQTALEAGEALYGEELRGVEERAAGGV